MRQIARLRLIAVLATVSVAWAHVPPVAAKEYKDVRYLPGWRYSGNSNADRDGQMLMDIVVPEDDKPRYPVLFVVHGGGWSAGDKGQGVYREIMEYFVQRGYVCVGLNYIMRPRGIFPQVFWDYTSAVRFLRKNAAKYHADPSRFGAIGLSAGGWLISSAGHGSGDLLCTNHQQTVHIAELWQRGWSRDARHYEDTFARPMRSPHPAYPDIYGGVQAISYDFSFRTKYGTGNSPACNQWVGEGYQPRPDDLAAIATGKFDYTQTVMTHASLRGRKVHVPPLFASIQKDGSNKAEAISRDGQRRVDAIERIYQFFQHELVEHPRTPVPEIHPSRRIITKEAEVRFVMPMEAEIRYQVVPLQPAKGKPWSQWYPVVTPDEYQQWDRYSKPFKVTSNCLVRAIATSPGRRDSTVAEAHFISGPQIPEITSPDTDELPAAKTGQHYSVRFRTNTQTARWFLAGDLVPHAPRNQAHFSYPNNMVMDYQTGEWSGTPTRPGRYWVQIWCNAQPGGPAGYRNYTWTVTGDDLSEQPPAGVELNDPNVELVYLPGGKSVPASQIGKELNQHGVRAISQREEQGTLFLVHQDDREKAKRVVAAYLKSIKYKGEVQWQ